MIVLYTQYLDKCEDILLSAYFVDMFYAGVGAGGGVLTKLQSS